MKGRLFVNKKATMKGRLFVNKRVEKIYQPK